MRDNTTNSLFFFQVTEKDFDESVSTDVQFWLFPWFFREGFKKSKYEWRKVFVN